MSCKICKIRKNEIKEGFCSKKQAEDGLPFRCTGIWSMEKVEILKRYLSIFTKAMKGKWRLVYVDLFAGPGKCFDYITETFFDASPIIAAQHQLYFDKLIFVEKSEKIMNCLKERLKGLKNAEYIIGDCNDKIDEVLDKIPNNSLCLFFIDPTGLQFRFSTLQKIILSKKSKNDIIELLPYEMSIKRNLTKWIKIGKSKKLDDFLGIDDSIRYFNIKHDYYNTIVNLRKKSIGEIYNQEYISQSLRSSNNVALYHLFFISSNKLGQKFFKDSLKNSKPQRTLPF